jgi:ribonuclease P protein component
VQQPQSYTFGASQKLKSRKAIEQLFRQGNAFSDFPLRILWHINRHHVGGLQAGFTVGSRKFKKATDRNRIKRLMREACRLQKNELENVLGQKNLSMQVFFIFTGNELPQYITLFGKTRSVLNRLVKICTEMNPANT